MGQTRVDLQHLLEDLRDAYTGGLEETILTEVVANSLDSGASLISLVTHPADATLTIVDNGRGMQRRELARYHDVAASTKSRGDGIGFAGVGIKLGLLVSRDVTTETRRGASHVATRWHLANRYKAPWKWLPPPGLVSSRGTAVRLTLNNPLSPLLDAGFVEETLRRHFEPLLDPAFGPILDRSYEKGVTLVVDGRPLQPEFQRRADVVPVSLRLGRRRRPSALGYLARFHAPVPDDSLGIAVSTFGKVIKRGWDWLGLTPPAGVEVGGLIEVPDLAAALTLSKNDFARTGARGASYLAYRKAIQEVVSRQLAAWGDAAAAESNPRTVRLERDLERVLADLVDDFPLLRSLVDRRRGGQSRLPMPGRGVERVPGTLFAQGIGDSAAAGAATPAVEPALGAGEPPAPGPDSASAPSSEPGQGTAEPPADTDGSRTGPADTDGSKGGPAAAGSGAAAIGAVDAVPGRRRRARYGLLIQFESRADDPELGRLVDSTIWINDAHPAYVRASGSRSLGYHTALAVALALAPLAVGGRDEHAFITQFLAQWGGTQHDPPRRRRRRPSSRSDGGLLP